MDRFKREIEKYFDEFFKLVSTEDGDWTVKGFIDIYKTIYTISKVSPMSDLYLPRIISKIGIPPIKCQGIKTKLVPFIAQNIQWNGKGKWIEPFLGSGVVLFNIYPKRALVSDTNKHIIKLYRDIQSGKINELIVKKFLLEQGKLLKEKGKKHYYDIRDRFNEEFGSLDFLFLNRSCFNGLMRFNAQGKFNVPFGHKPDRFRQAYVTKIVNQISYIKNVIQNRDWEFVVSGWRETLSKAEKDDFVYLDPPYIGRHTDYYNSWSEKDAIELSKLAKVLPSGFALSMWLENKYRRNEHIDNHWDGLVIRTYSHFYHLGSTEDLRNEMQEALVIKPEYATTERELSKVILPEYKQQELFG